MGDSLAQKQTQVVYSLGGEVTSLAFAWKKKKKENKSETCLMADLYPGAKRFTSGPGYWLS
jgi:hypothetical protein